MQKIEKNQDIGNENAALRRELISLDQRVVALERSIVFRLLRSIGHFTGSLRRRVGKALLASPMHPLHLRLRGESSQVSRYRVWFERHRANDPMVSGPAPTDKSATRFSIILPTKSPNPEWLRQAVESVRRQTWTNWQLCISEDGEMPSDVRAFLNDVARAEPRIILVRGAPEGISAALNRGLAVATGEFVAFLDHDDLLESTALAHAAERLTSNSLDLVYTDEDYIGADGLALRPNFKPGWSPELLLTCMYMGHLIVARRELVVDAGGFDPDTDGSQDYDLVLKLVDRGARVGHIPRVLYHWRSHRNSTAHSNAAKPYSLPAGKRALNSSLQRRQVAAEVIYGDRPNTYRIRLDSENHAVTVIIPTRSPRLLRECLKALYEKTVLPQRFQLIVVHHETEAGADEAIRAAIGDYKAIVVPFGGSFNFARMMNEAVKVALGEILVFFNDDVAPVNGEWLLNLTSRLQSPGVGVSGARLLYPDGTIQHAGIVVGMADATGHAGRFLYDSSWWPWINSSRDVSAVTGACLATTRQIFCELGGFDERFPNNYNDVDFCLRAHLSGFRTVVENDAVLIHYEGLTRSARTSLTDRLAFFRVWGSLLETPDPFFTRHLRLDREDLSLDLGE